MINFSTKQFNILIVLVKFYNTAKICFIFSVIKQIVIVFSIISFFGTVSQLPFAVYYFHNFRIYLKLVCNGFILILKGNRPAHYLLSQRNRFGSRSTHEIMKILQSIMDIPAKVIERSLTRTYN